MTGKELVELAEKHKLDQDETETLSMLMTLHLGDVAHTMSKMVGSSDSFLESELDREHAEIEAQEELTMASASPKVLDAYREWLKSLFDE